MSDVSLCSRIKEARLAAGLSQKALAERVGISWSFFRNIERGRCPVGRLRFLNIILLAGALSWDINRLAFDVENET